MRRHGFNVALGVGLAVLVGAAGISTVLRPHLVTLYRSAFPEKVEFGRGTIAVGGHQVEVEIASTDFARDRGLMYRSNLQPDTGMLFVFDTADQKCMWMKTSSRRNCDPRSVSTGSLDTSSRRRLGKSRG
jgi:hypothetical protein